jgi:small GTP-binding protein
MEATDDFDLAIEIMVIGQSGSGKTNLIQRFVNNKFSDSNIPTISTDVFRVQDTFNGIKARVKFWDTAGQERFQALTASFYHNADAVILVYDTTNRESFQKISFWLSQVKINCRKPVRLMLIGNKNDLVSDRQIALEEAKSFAKHNDMMFFEASAKTNEAECVNVAFRSLIEETSKVLYVLVSNERKIHERVIRESITRLEEKSAPKKKNDGCC